MPLYAYRGRNARGKIVRGTMDVESEELVAIRLTESGITPISIVMARSAADMGAWQRIKELLGLGRAKTEDLEMFCRQMYTMTKSGVPLVRAIKVIAESTEPKNLRAALFGIVEGLEAGHSLARSMHKYPLIFPSLILSMVDVGENTGRLEEVFEQLSHYLQKDIETQKRIKVALRYPIFVLITLAVAITVLNLFVIPSFANFFKNLGVDLPLPTRIMIAFSDFFVAYWKLMLLILVSVILSWTLYINSNVGKGFNDKYKLKVPIFGHIIKRSLLARFCRTFSMTVMSGVPMLQSLTICSRGVNNLFISEHIMSMRSGVERGESFSTTAKDSGMFTPLVLQMVEVGEETGQIDQLLLEVSEHYERDVDYDISRISESIQPILIGFLSVLVLILAMGIFLPMWDLASKVFAEGF